MPFLEFRITATCLSLQIDQATESWKLTASAVCASLFPSPDSFRLRHEGQIYSGNNAEARLTIESRPSRVELPAIGTDKPYDPKDEHRDIVRVDFLEEPIQQPYFQLTISLADDAFQRLASADLGKTKVIVVVENEILGQALVYGDDPDGRDIVWNADEAQYLFLRRVNINFMSPANKDSGAPPVPSEAQKADPFMSEYFTRVSSSLDRMNQELIAISRKAGVIALVVVLTLLATLLLRLQ